MIFVDFPDAQARLESAAATGQHLLGGGAAQQLYHDQSYGQLIFDVTKRSDLGWRRLSKRSTNYDFENFESQRSFTTMPHLCSCRRKSGSPITRWYSS